ncbi:MAG: ion transporter [Lachnospiraceae bacterium]|nr:ion transporter [Lachnospiraceae bacterium]
MRKRIFQILETGEDKDRPSQIYDVFMMIAIIVSIAPLAIKIENTYTIVIDRTTVIIFIIDYLLRLLTADYKLKKGALSFVRYPFTLMAIVDLISILPSLSILSRGFRVLKVARLVRTLRVFRVFKAFRYSKNITILINVFRKQKDSLFVVCWLALGYIVITALIMFNFEPDTFDTFFDAIYWATVSLTTVGYGDIYATSVIGKIITMISALFGIAIVALPAGIITAGYMNEVEKT